METQLEQLRSDNARIIEAQRSYNAKQDMTDEDIAQFEANELLLQENQKKEKELDVRERAKKYDAKRSEEFGSPLIKIKRTATPDDRNDAARAFACGSHRLKHRCHDSWKRSADLCGINWEGNEWEVCLDNTSGFRANQASDVTTTGGYLQNDGVFQGLVSAKKAYGKIEQVASVYQTDTGETLDFGLNDDTGNVGSISAQNASQTSTDFALTQNKLLVYDVKSSNFKVSFQLIEDARFPIADYIGQKLGERIFRKEAALFTTGAGTTEPTGYMTSTTVGSHGISSALVAADIYDLYFAVDAAYRESPNCVWVMNSATLGSLMTTLVDDQHRPLWGAGLNSDPGQSLLGKRIVINEQMASMSGSTSKPIAFGDFSQFYIRRVKNLRVIRDDSVFVQSLAAGFFAWDRVDSLLMDFTSVHPIYHLSASASGTA